MSEICFECFNKSNDYKYTPKDFIISKELGLCEDCGEYKPVIITFRRPFYVILYRSVCVIIRIIFNRLFFKNHYKKQFKTKK